MRSNYKKIGDFIKQSKLKNEDGRIDRLLGVNLDKKFMPSVANLNGVDLTKYKVIQKGQFGCKLMSVGRDKKVPISRLTSYEEAIISSAYFVFEVIDENVLNPEYLMMWFSRSESDRFQWFQSGADIRGRITWEEFCSLPIKVPSIEKQRAIVKEYNTIVNRIKLNEQFNRKLEETAQALYKHWFVDFEFPVYNEDGTLSSVEGYKSSGRKMVYNEELDQEIPKGWSECLLPDLIEVKYGKDYKHLSDGDIPLYGSGGIMNYVNDFLYDKASVLIPRKGTLSNIMYVDEPFWSVDTMFYSKLKNKDFAFYTFYFLKQLDFMSLNVGSAVPSMTTKMLNSFKLVMPDPYTLKRFNSALNSINSYSKNLRNQNKGMQKLASSVLSKMSKVESLKTEQVT